jgi:IMP dehydrogenase
MQFVDDPGLTFDDVLLVPRYNEISSRQDVCLETRIVKGGEKLAAPLLSANMNTVTESEMMVALSYLGCAGVLHRFLTLDRMETELCTFVRDADAGSPVIASLGVNGDVDDLLELYKRLGFVDIICIDVAHGHSLQVLDMIKRVKDTTDCKVIAGNVATPSATRSLIEAGADAVKVGIGPGSLCTTRLVTGVGVPQLTAIFECYWVAEDYDVPIIADGGLRSSGDVVKALAAGAETVMSGSFFCATNEAPGELVEDHGRKYKKYQGMASKDAMIGWKGPGYHAAPEGESTLVPCKGPVEAVVQSILAGVRSGMTYNGAHNLEELRENAVFRGISPSCLIENRPHGK